MPETAQKARPEPTAAARPRTTTSREKDARSLKRASTSAKPIQSAIQLTTIAE